MNKKPVQKSKYPQELIPRAASFFRVVGDDTRMRILCTIADSKDSEIAAGDIALAIGVTKSATSHQLALLKDEGLVKSRRDGKNIYYSLDDEHVEDILKVAFTHIGHKK